MAETPTPGNFIPHDTAVVAPRPRGSGLNDLLLLVGIVLFVASAALAIGVFLYVQFLQQQNSSKLAQLQRAEAAFEPSLIAQITRLDDRMHAAQKILSAHLAPTAFFQALDQATLQTVSFQSLDLESPDPQHITLRMQGVAQSVNSIALQAEVFSKSGVIVSPIFSNIARQADGVHFDFSAAVNPTALNYTSLVASAGGAVQGGQTSAPATPTTPAPSGGASAPPSSGNPFGGTAPQQTTSQPQGAPQDAGGAGAQQQTPQQ
jgi:hypothetical protein